MWTWAAKPWFSTRLAFDLAVTKLVKGGSPTLFCFPVSPLNSCCMIPQRCLLSEWRFGAAMPLLEVATWIILKITFILEKSSLKRAVPHMSAANMCLHPPPSPLHRLFLGQGRTYFKIEFKIGSQFAIWLGAELQLVSWSRIGVCNDSAVLFECSLYVSK